VGYLASFKGIDPLPFLPQILADGHVLSQGEAIIVFGDFPDPFQFMLPEEGAEEVHQFEGALGVHMEGLYDARPAID